MTRVPRPQEPVDLWSRQFKPSFLIQGLLDTFSSQENSDPVEHCCFACHQIGKTTRAKSACEDCDIMFCEPCAKIHVAAPNGRDHVILPLEVESTMKRKVMCKEHTCLIEFYCKDCQKAVCKKCCISHREGTSVVTIDSMIPEINEELLQKYEEINSKIERTETILKNRRSDVESITQHESSLQSKIKRVSKDTVDIIRRKEKKLLDELKDFTEKQTALLRSQMKFAEIDLQTYHQYREFIKQVLQSDSPMDLLDMYTLCQSGEITAGIKRNDKQRQGKTKISFEEQLDIDQFDKTFQLGQLTYVEEKPSLPDTPNLLSKVSTGTTDDNKFHSPIDIEVMNIDGQDILVVIDFNNNCVKSCYPIDGTPNCASLKLDGSPFSLTKISQDRVAVLHEPQSSISLVKLTPDPVRTSSIPTQKMYICLVALSDTTLAAGCHAPPCIDVLDLSGIVLRSLTPPSSPLIGKPRYMCSTLQGQIVVADGGSRSVYCLTQQGEVLFNHNLTESVSGLCGGVTTTDTGSVIAVDYFDNKIFQLTETGEYVRDLLTGCVVEPKGIRVHGNKLYVAERRNEHIKIFQL